MNVKFIALKPHPFPTSTQIRHRTFPRPSVVTSFKYTSTDESPFDHHWGGITSYKTIFGLKHKILSGTFDSTLCSVRFLFAAKCYINLLWKINSTWWCKDYSTPSHSLELFKKIQFQTIKVNSVTEEYSSSHWNSRHANLRFCIFSW